MSVFRSDQNPVTVTQHAVKRYWERVPESNNLDGPQAEQVIRERLEQATYLWTGNMGSSSNAKFYLHDGLILVVGVADGAVVTLYPVDYGFGEEIDAIIMKKLLKEVLDLQKSIKRIEEQQETTNAALQREMDTMDARIATLKAEIELHENAKQAIQAKLSQTDSAKNLQIKRLHEAASKLILSKRYSAETLVEVQTAARAGTGKK